ncbi:MAG: hypothetical protein ACYTG4_16800 [Planctomycetota bacterium]|jgi:hypothetical protein
MNRTLIAIALTILAAAGLGFAALDSGQGPDPDGECLVEDVNLGEFWYGQEVTHDDLVGKVVLVELWGS